MPVKFDQSILVALKKSRGKCKRREPSGVLV